jgi:hypothetical protein
MRRFVLITNKLGYLLLGFVFHASLMFVGKSRRVAKKICYVIVTKHQYHKSFFVNGSAAKKFGVFVPWSFFMLV